VKVLDFGLAKALVREEPEISASNSPTLSLAATQQGVILGTAAYMAPEQAKGRSVDKRADIWAFGCVVYEMLTGKRAFEGEDVSDTLASVLRSTVTLGGIARRDTAPHPPGSELVFPTRPETACARHWGSAPGAGRRVRRPGNSSPNSPSRYLASALGHGLGCGSGPCGAWFSSAGVVGPAEPTYLSVSLEAGQHLSGGIALEDRIALQRPSRPSFALSPDGRRLIYVASDGQIWVFDLGLKVPTRLTSMGVNQYPA